MWRVKVLVLGVAQRVAVWQQKRKDDSDAHREARGWCCRCYRQAAETLHHHPSHQASHELAHLLTPKPLHAQMFHKAHIWSSCDLLYGLLTFILWFLLFYYSAAAFICSLKQRMSRREVSACAKGQQPRILCLWYISTLANAVRRQNIYEGRKNSLTFLSCWLFIDGKWCHWPLKELLHYLDMQSGGAEDQSPDWRKTCWTSWARVATIAVWKTCKNHEHRWNTLKADWFFKSIKQVMILSKLKAGVLV